MGEQSSGGGPRPLGPSDQGQMTLQGPTGGGSGGANNGGQQLNNKSNKLLGLANNGQTASTINRLHYQANSQSSLMIETESNDDQRLFDQNGGNLTGAKARQYLDDDDDGHPRPTSARGQVEEGETTENPSVDKEGMTTSPRQTDRFNRPTDRQSSITGPATSVGASSNIMAPGEVRNGGGGSGGGPRTSNDVSNNSGTSPQDGSKNNSDGLNLNNLPQVCFVQNPNGGFSLLPQPGNNNANNVPPRSGMAPDMDTLEMCMRQHQPRYQPTNSNDSRGFHPGQGPFIMQNPNNSGLQGSSMMYQNPTSGQAQSMLQGTYNGQGPYMMQNPSTGQRSMIQGPSLMQGSYIGGQGMSMTQSPQGRNLSPGPPGQIEFGPIRQEGKIQGGQGFGPFVQRRSEGKIQGFGGPFVSLGPEARIQHGGGGQGFGGPFEQVGLEGMIQDDGMFDPRLIPPEQQQRGSGVGGMGGGMMQLPIGGEMMTPGNNDRMMIQQQQSSPGILNSASSRLLRGSTGPVGNMMMGPGIDLDPSTMMMDPQMSNGPGPNNFPGFVEPSIQNGFETIDCYIPQPIVDCYLIPQQSMPPQGRCRGSNPPVCIDTMCIQQNPNQGCPPQQASQIIPLPMPDEVLMMQQEQPQRSSRCPNSNNDQRITLIREVYHFKKTPRPCPSKKQVMDCCPTASIMSCGNSCRPPWTNSYNYKPQNGCRRKIAPRCCPQIPQCPETLEPRCSLLNNCPPKLPRSSPDGCPKRVGCYLEKPKGCRTPTTLVREYVLTGRNSSVKRNKINNGENNEGSCQVAAVITTVPPNCLFKGNNNQAEIQALLNSGNNYNNEGTSRRNSGNQNGRASLAPSQKSVEPEEEDEGGSEGSNQASLKKKMSSASNKKFSTASNGSHNSGHSRGSDEVDASPPSRKKSSTRKNSTGSSL